MCCVAVTAGVTACCVGWPRARMAAAMPGMSSSGTALRSMTGPAQLRSLMRFQTQLLLVEEEGGEEDC